MWPFSKKAKTAEPEQTRLSTLPHDVLAQGILLTTCSGVRLAAVYANMAGFPDEVITPENAPRFDEIIQAPPAFTPAGIEVGVHRVVEGCNILCQSGAFNTLIFGVTGQDNAANRPELERFCSAVRHQGLNSLCAEAGFDLRAFLTETSTERREADLRALFAKLEEKRDYLKPLLLRARAKGRNKYGDLDYTDYVAELAEFLRTYFQDEDLQFFYHRMPLMACMDFIEPWFAEGLDPLAMPLDGIDFEHWCAARIEAQGWAVRVSKSTGDQGVDIEAMRGGKTVAVQCKRYQQPIGNKSVQEAFTGMTHYSADLAVVIGTGGFTKAALDVAASSGVILLDAENISEFSSIVETRLQQMG
jgi:hypothetical protein